ncbi:MAG: low molecular weight phosphotyrosine protein phosphatase [Candidatus Omnitrophica bacterium]|nr:low molecular weight phosphotyrosine protein phosphatase [Candidatus Omnitrophota bacterium]
MDKKAIKKILIICTGNSCRSVMAEGYLQKRLLELGLDISVDSAGTATFYGLKPPKETAEVMGELGIYVENHRAKPISEELVREADLILVMEPEHKTVVLSLDPDSKGKIMYLADFGEEAGHSVPDPIRQGAEFYRDVLEIIKRSTEGFLKWLTN